MQKYKNILRSNNNREMHEEETIKYEATKTYLSLPVFKIISDVLLLALSFNIGNNSEYKGFK